MQSSAYRRSMVAGVIFVIFFVVGAMFAITGPNTKSSDTANTIDQKWVSWLSSSGNRASHLIGAYLLILGGIMFIWFCQGLRTRLEATGPDGLGEGRFVAAMSVFCAGAMGAAAMTSAVVPGAVTFGGEKAPTTGDATHWLNDLTVPFLIVVFALGSAAIIATVVMNGRRTGGLPRWALGFGWVAVLGSIVGAIFFPMVLPLLWYLGVAINGLRAPAVATAV